jgi:hypothetical protein
MAQPDTIPKQQPMVSTNLEKSELKQQGAIEIAQRAVQDPQSNIRPELVEEVLVEETRKAGVPAYQFDPDASTDEKRAVVRAVSHPNCFSFFPFFLTLYNSVIALIPIS